MLENWLRRGQSSRAEQEKVGLGSTRRPVLGLALGGGAARGFAHIGVIRALMARNIVPDVVVGTSIGAAVGAAYATGHLDTFEEWARSLQPRNVFGYLDIQLNGSGLIGGAKLASQLEAAMGDMLIEEMPMKFATVATEITTGHEIWLTRGKLVEAVRASYALPGIFSPVSVGDRWLVDGALVNPVPVSAARALGAEIVVAVNLNADNFGHGVTILAHGSRSEAPKEETPVPEAEPDKPAKRGFLSAFAFERTMKREFFGTAVRPGISTVMTEAFNIMQDRITRARLAGDPPDVLISPRVGRIGWFDFHRADDSIAHGRRAAERTIESIEEAIAFATPDDGAPSAPSHPSSPPDASPVK